MNILVIQDCLGADYLQDMINHSLIALSSSISIHFTSIPNYIFSDYEDVSTIRGRGFTLYGKVPPKLRPAVTSHDVIVSGLKSSKYDLVIYPSIRRCRHLLSLVLRFLPKHRILFFDGEDDYYIDIRLAVMGTYYKREYRIFSFILAKPVSFAFPAISLPDHTVPISSKIRFLAQYLPNASSYIYQDEQEYYLAYQDSLFAITTKKGGWDCLRHYEIIANHCIPVFPDYHSIPFGCMSSYPALLQQKANHLYSESIHKNILSDPVLCNVYSQLLLLFQRSFTSSMLCENYYPQIFFSTAPTSFFIRCASLLFVPLVFLQNICSLWKYSAFREALRLSVRNFLVFLKLYPSAHT